MNVKAALLDVTTALLCLPALWAVVEVMDRIGPRIAPAFWATDTPASRWITILIGAAGWGVATAIILTIGVSRGASIIAPALTNLVCLAPPYVLYAIASIPGGPAENQTLIVQMAALTAITTAGIWTGYLLGKRRKGQATHRPHQATAPA